MIKNIMLAGVGGQGLVLMTKIISNACFYNGYDVKTNDVIGLSQRGGMVWGNVRFGDKVYSPNIKEGEADVLVSLEPMESLRWSHVLKKEGTIIMNTKEIYSTPVQQEKSVYPKEGVNELSEIYKVIDIDAFEEAKNLGKKQVANTILLGVLSKYVDVNEDSWIKALEENVKREFIDINKNAFDLGRKYSKKN